MNAMWEGTMQLYHYGNPDASVVFIQPVDAHDLAEMEAEIGEIRKQAAVDFHLIAVQVNSWNGDLSPWRAPAVFGKEDFGDGAAEMLQGILGLCTDKSRTYYLGGYSLAGLFSLWAAYQTDVFAGIAAASPSMWFPGFLSYMKTHELRTKAVYLSLGDKEQKTRQPLMATVAERIRNVYDLLQARHIPSTLEWNKGNHFQDNDIRTAKAFAWLLEQHDKG